MKLLLFSLLAAACVGCSASSLHAPRGADRVAATPRPSPLSPFVSTSLPSSAPADGIEFATPEATGGDLWTLRGRAMLPAQEFDLVIGETAGGERLYARISVTPIVITDGDIVSVTPAVRVLRDGRELSCAAGDCAERQQAPMARSNGPETPVTRVQAVFDRGVARSADGAALAVPRGARRLLSITIDLGEQERAATLTWPAPTDPPVWRNSATSR